MTNTLPIIPKPLLGPGYTSSLCSHCIGTGRLAASTVDTSHWPICYFCQAKGWQVRRTHEMVVAQDRASELLQALASCPMNLFKTMSDALFDARAKLNYLETYVPPVDVNNPPWPRSKHATQPRPATPTKPE